MNLILGPSLTIDQLCVAAARLKRPWLDSFPSLPFHVCLSPRAAGRGTFLP